MLAGCSFGRTSEVSEQNMSAGADGVRMTAVLQLPGYEEERLQRAAEQLLCREAQAGILLSLMGEVGMLISEIQAFTWPF